VQPELPAIAPDVRAQMTNGIARILVHLDARGAILDANVAASTGNTSLDLIALGMAKNATYSPAYAACKPVAGEYTFSAKFIAW
jgi:TonB family protein